MKGILREGVGSPPTFSHSQGGQDINKSFSETRVCGRMHVYEREFVCEAIAAPRRGSGGERRGADQQVQANVSSSRAERWHKNTVFIVWVIVMAFPQHC